MKKGYLANTHEGLIPSYYDFVYIEAMFGKVVNPKFQKYWDMIPANKRGLIHQPVLSSNMDEYANASSFLELVEQLGRNNWDNGIPLIMDMWQAPPEQRFNLDHVRVYGSYITDHFKPKVKPLLRLNVATWNAFVDANYTEAMRLMRNWDILLLQPGAIRPASLKEIGLPKWFEYEFGKYAFDEVGTWLDPVVSVPKPVDPIIPDPIIPDPPIETAKKKYKISLLGGLINGTIEEE